MWATDGIRPPQLVDDLATGAGSSVPWGFMGAGRNIYFTANDHKTGNELWAVPRSNLLRVFNLAKSGAAAAESNAGGNEAAAASGRPLGCCDEFGPFAWFTSDPLDLEPSPMLIGRDKEK